MRFLLLAALLLAPVAQADNLWLHVGSRHNPPGPYNERNEGLGWEIDLTDTVSVELGWYDNSAYRTSRYIWGGYELLETRHWRVRVTGGVVDGYGGRKFADGRASAVGGLTVEYRRARVLLIPSSDLNRIGLVGLSVRLLEWQ